MFCTTLIASIPKKQLVPKLEKEAPDFLAAILNLELPLSYDRLNVPVIETQDKIDAQKANRSFLETFIEDHCYYEPGEWVKYSDFYQRFIEWLDPNFHHHWSIIRVGKELPKDKYPKARNPKDAQWYIR